MRHRTLAAGRWGTLTLAEQLGNIGSEFARVLTALQHEDENRLRSARQRFFELMQLTVTDPRWRGLRRQELARVAEICAEIFQNPTSDDTQKQQRYFDQFALLARAQR